MSAVRMKIYYCYLAYAHLNIWFAFGLIISECNYRFEILFAVVLHSKMAWQHGHRASNNSHTNANLCLCVCKSNVYI